MTPWPILIVGVGNVLLRDDGVGVAVVREMERRAGQGELAPPAGTTLVDGGTLGLGLLPLLAGARAIVLVDALDRGRRPGTVEVIRGEALAMPATGGPAAGPASGGPAGGDVALGRGGVGDLLAAAVLAGADPEAIVLVGIQPGEIAIGLGLTTPVLDALEAAIEITLEEVHRMAPSRPAPRNAQAGRRQDAAERAA